MSFREVICQDAIEWLQEQIIVPDTSYLASLPDISEFPQLTLTEWKNWFVTVAKLILSKTPEAGVTIFYQSDIKHEGEWVDKGYLCQKAAEELGHKLLWHKIICRAPAGVATFGRPAYSHILCFSKSLNLDVAKSTADVLQDVGEKTWQRGIGIEACIMIGKFLSEQTSTKTLINPFCGEGSMLASANAFHLNSIGVERSPKRAEKAKYLKLNLSQKLWE